MTQTPIQTQNKIQKDYLKLHKIVFKYWIFFLIAIFAIIKVYWVISKDHDETIQNQPMTQQKQTKITEFHQKLSQIDLQKSFTGLFAFGEISETEEYIESFNNLLYYNWFVVPRFFWLSNTAPIQDIEYFQKSAYSLEEIDTLYRNVFIWSNKHSKQPPQNTSFPLSQSIIQEFNLSCIFQKKASNIICDVFIDKFLDEFFVYNIESEINDFQNIMHNILTQKKYNNKACLAMLNYDFYSQKEHHIITELFSFCEPKYQTTHRNFLDFVEVQNELFSKHISNKIYKDDIINIYKLISFQQIIYDDIENKILNTDRIHGYFWFLQELLKRDRLDTFYKELSYFFNNYYIKKAGSNIEITNKISNKSELDELNKQITSLNNGNILIWYKWLKDDINPNLIVAELNIENEVEQTDEQQNIENLLQQIKNIEIKQSFISGNQILISGIWTIIDESIRNPDEDNRIPIATKIQLEEDRNTLQVKQVAFEAFEWISDTINQILETNKRVYADLQRYVEQNKFLFITTKTEQIVEVETICENIKNALPNYEIRACDNSKVNIDLFRKNKVISMNISHKDFILTKIDVSDQEAKTMFNQYLEETKLASKISREKTTKETFVGFIVEVISDFLSFNPKTSDTTEWSLNTLIVIERIKQYMWIQLKDILERDWKILIEFNITNIPFLGYYDIESHKISPLYFKEANQEKNPLLIKNFSLIMSESGKELINSFKNNPLETIRHYSPDEYLLYQKFISEK